MKDVPEKTALLVMDVEPGIVDRVADKDAYLDRVRATIDQAHESGVPVIFVIVGFRPGFPEVSDRNKRFSTVKQNALPQKVNPQPLLPPTGDDIVVTKRRVSAFSGSDLEIVLRAKSITHLVLAGVATSGVVLSTVREAADKDFQLTVLSDLCADTDPDVHSLLIEKVFPTQAEVLTSEEWTQSLAG